MSCHCCGQYKDETNTLFCKTCNTRGCNLHCKNCVNCDILCGDGAQEKPFTDDEEEVSENTTYKKRKREKTAIHKKKKKKKIQKNKSFTELRGGRVYEKIRLLKIDEDITEKFTKVCIDGEGIDKNGDNYIVINNERYVETDYRLIEFKESS